MNARNLEYYKKFPKGGKIAFVQGLSEIGFSIRQISRFTGFGCGTVQRYIKFTRDPNWSHIRHAVVSKYMDNNIALTRKVVDAISLKIQDIDSVQFKDLCLLLSVLNHEREQISSGTTNTAKNKGHFQSRFTI